MKRRFWKLIGSLSLLHCAAIGVLLTANRATGATVYVSPVSINPLPPYATWATAARTIPQAVNAAVEGDEIVVTNGVYAGDIWVAKRVSVRSVNGPRFTIIDGGGVTQCAGLGNGASLSGFTLRNGVTDYYGGGVDGESPDRAFLTNCVITANSSSYLGGGAFYCTLYNCTLTGNSAAEGGGAYGCELYNCAVTDNRATNIGGGADGCTLYNCTLTGNAALNYGGGAAACKLYNCIAYFNTAANGGNYDPSSVLEYSCSTPLAPGRGNIDLEPRLTLGTQVSLESPCRGAGSSAYALGTDIDSEPWRNPPSMGCDEYYATPKTGPLAVSLVANYTNVAVGFPVSLAALIEGRVSASAWDFGDGTIVSNRPYASHAWTAPGDYEVNLRAFNDSYPAGVSATATIHVSARPVYHVAAGSTNPLPPYASWSTAATNIQSAVNAASLPGALVLVSNGVYEAGLSTNTTHGVEVLTPVTIQSVNGPQYTFLDGGGRYRCISMTNDTSLTGFTLTRGWAPDGGGALGTGPNVSLANCVIVQNFAGRGGAVAGCTLITCTLSNNSAGQGGAAFNCTLGECFVNGNSAPGGFGGAVAYSTLYNCQLNGNSATNGSATYRCVVANCTLSTNSGFAAAAESTLVNSALVGNVYAGAFSSTLYNCTLTDNECGAFGCTLQNCIVYYNGTQGSINYDDSCVLNSCCTTPLPVGGVGNISDEPLFANRAGGDFRLQASSPCINTGNNAYAFGAADLDGNPRILGNTVDMGAYEFQQSGSPIRYVWQNSPSPAPPFASWSTAAHTIQDAVDAAAPGDEIVVTNGVYATGGRAVGTNVLANRVALDKPLRLRSVNGPQFTIIQGNPAPGGGDGDGAIRCVYVGTNAVLNGFTLTNGHTRALWNWVNEGYGGGAWCEVSGVITNCTLSGNSATGLGGGAYGGTLNNCILTRNSAPFSGGGAAGGTLNNCLLTANSGGYGGGAYEATLNNCILTGNSAASGGGTYLATLNNCTLRGNSAGSGGGSYCGTLNNCALTGNSAMEGGGAYSESHVSSATLNNCTLTGNWASKGGGAYSGTLNNCIVYYNTAVNEPNYFGSVFAYSCTTPLPAGPGNLEAEPLLASATHLSAESPCIGRGSASYTSGVDIDGESWLNPPCIGADQFVDGQNGGPLTVGIAAAYTNMAAGFTVSFHALINGQVTASVWDFGDGAVANNRPFITHAWSVPGDYVVRLTVYNDSNPGGVSATMLVRVTAGEVYYVNGSNATPMPPYRSWATASRTIQEAIDAGAQIGRLVLVADGFYDSGGRAAYGLLTNRVVVAEGVELRSVNGPAVTVISGAAPSGGTYGEGGIRCAYVGTNAVLSGFTLTNGHAVSDYFDEGNGGGAKCAGSGVVTNCIVCSNSASGNGGGVYGGTVNNCSLSNNVAGSGGAAAAGALNNCDLTRNSANTGGGAADAILNHCTLSGNSCNGAGGGAFGSTLNNCTLTGNFAGGYGGGGAWGGTLNNCVLTGNSAYGGSASSYASLNNCTVTSNSGAYGGAALAGTLNNCIIYHNGGINYSESTALNYCCTTPLPANGVGNITNAPLLVDIDSGDLRLQLTSPCINAGFNAYAPGTTDLDGNPRIVGGTVDIGAYEFQSPGSLLSYAWLQQYGLPTDGSADYADPDGEGMNNWQEWISGTCPTNALSALRLLSASRVGKEVTVSWQSVGGVKYFLERSTNLSLPLPPAGSDVSVLATDIVGQAGTTSYTDTNATGAGFFYRVGVKGP